MAARQPAVALVRAVLLAAVVLGVALMHTLGHDHGDHDQMTMPVMAASRADPPSAHHPGVVSAQPSGQADASVGGEGGSRAPWDPATVCLAVLAMLGLVVGLRLLFQVVVGHTAGGRGGPSIVRPVIRGSPPLPALALIRVAVLRN